MAEGLTPALKAARTAFSFPFVRPPATSSTVVRRPAVFASACSCGLATQPRRSASAVTAASKVSISALSSRLSDLARFFGNKCRGSEPSCSGARHGVRNCRRFGRFRARRSRKQVRRLIGRPEDGHEIQLCRRAVPAATTPQSHVSLAHELSGLGSTRVVRFSASGWRRSDEPDDVATGPEDAEVSRRFEPVGAQGAIAMEAGELLGCSERQFRRYRQR